MATGIQCPACGADLPPGARFCDRCGAAVARADVHDPFGPYRAEVPPQGATPPGAPAVRVPNHLVPAILATVLCCAPFGIPAIIYAARVNEKVARGDMEGARRDSRLAGNWALAALVTGLVFGIVYLVIVIAMKSASD